MPETRDYDIRPYAARTKGCRSQLAQRRFQAGQEAGAHTRRTKETRAGGGAVAAGGTTCDDPVAQGAPREGSALGGALGAVPLARARRRSDL